MNNGTDCISYFDYTSDTTSAMLNLNNNNCLEQLTNKNTKTCNNEYRNCLQYFNTLPVYNCIDFVPQPYNLIVEE